jgi:hypothetical protein
VQQYLLKGLRGKLRKVAGAMTDLRSMRSMRGGFIFHSWGPLLKVLALVLTGNGHNHHTCEQDDPGVHRCFSWNLCTFAVISTRGFRSQWGGFGPSIPVPLSGLRWDAG